MSVVFLLGNAIFICLAFSFIEDSSGVVWVRLLLLLLAMSLEVLVYWAADLRSIPLTVSPDGQVCFGKRELCGPRTVRGVQIMCRRGKATDCEVYLELNEGKRVLVPPHYFGDFELREEARPLAEQLAEALGVKVRN